GWESVFGGDGGITIIDPNNPSTVYAQVNSFLLRTDDGGNNFIGIVNGILPGPTTFPYVPEVMDPSNSHRLLTGTDRVYETLNRGDLWKPLSTPNLNGWESSATIHLLATAYNDPNVIYAEAGGDIFV